MPPLPVDGAAATAAGAETAIAFAIESARRAHEAGPLPAPALRDLFTTGLAALIRQAAEHEGGDAAFQAMVLRAGEPVVDAYVRLSAHANADARAVRAAVNAVAHPGKSHGMAAGTSRDRLAQLHAFATGGHWAKLQHAWSKTSSADDLVLARLERLARLGALQPAPVVQHYLALCRQRGPLAGSEAATVQGRMAARTGDIAEQATVGAFRRIAARLNESCGGYEVVRSLKTPPGFPGEAAKAKDEWDAAIVRTDEGGVGTIVLLAEVKAAPAAATSDFSRLHRGLQRLAQAEPEVIYTFAAADGEVRLLGGSLRQLQPQGRDLPAHVIYCSPAPTEMQPAMLSAATRAVLLAEPESIAFALQLTAEAPPATPVLAAIWDALQTQPRLRSALHQFDTARRVRDAMLHPDDLLAALALRLPGTTPTCPR